MPAIIPNTVPIITLNDLLFDSIASVTGAELSINLSVVCFVVDRIVGGGVTAAPGGIL